MGGATTDRHHVPIRRIGPPSPAPAAPEPVRAGRFGTSVLYSPEDVASGRGVTYEWEQFLVDVFGRLAVVEESGGGGGSVSGEPGVSFVHTQASAAATWTITHELGTKPVVVVVSGGGLVLADVAYSSDDVVVVTFGRPYAGMAYLRG